MRRRTISTLVALLAAVALSLWPITPASAATGVLLIVDVDLGDGDTETVTETNPDDGECINVNDNDHDDDPDNYQIVNGTNRDVEAYDEDDCEGDIVDTVGDGQTDLNVSDPCSIKVKGEG